MAYFLKTLLTLPGILLAFVINGFARAYTSDKLGDPSPRNMGKLNLSPLTHIDPIGFLLILVSGFGWTKPVFTDSRYYKNRKRGEILVALSGSIGNFLLAFLCLILQKIMLHFGMLNNFTSPLLLILSYAMAVNISLGLFVLLPIYPLSGFQILEALVGSKYYSVLNFLQQYGFYILLLLMFSGVLKLIIAIPYSIILAIMHLLINAPFLLFEFVKKYFPILFKLIKK